jgi:hypothetical protein
VSEPTTILDLDDCIPMVHYGIGGSFLISRIPGTHGYTTAFPVSNVDWSLAKLTGFHGRRRFRILPSKGRRTPSQKKPTFNNDNINTSIHNDNDDGVSWGWTWSHSLRRATE